jgi:hypothetical protein
LRNSPELLTEEEPAALINRNAMNMPALIEKPQIKVPIAEKRNVKR